MAAATRPDDTATTADHGGLEFGRLLMYGLALASLAAGIIHCSAALDHAQDDLPWHAGLLVVSSAAQLAWAGLILRRSSKRWLLVGLVVNFVLVLAWVLSRSTGVPLIPGAQEAEPLGFKDVTTAFFELAVVIGVGLFAALPVAVRRLRLPAGRLAFEAMLTAALLLVFFGLSQAPHSHGGPGHGHGAEVALSSDHHAAGNETGHDHGTAAGDAHKASAGHSHDQPHRWATDAAEADGSDIDHPHDGGHAHDADEGNVRESQADPHVHQAGSAADPHSGHHHGAAESTPSRAGRSAQGRHSHAGSTAAGEDHHRDGENQSAAGMPGKEPEGHDHSGEPSGSSGGHDHTGPDSSGGDGGHNQSGDHGHGQDHGGAGSDPAKEEVIVKAFFSFLNTITKAVGLGPV